MGDFFFIIWKDATSKMQHKRFKIRGCHLKRFGITRNVAKGPGSLVEISLIITDLPPCFALATLITFLPSGVSLVVLSILGYNCLITWCTSVLCSLSSPTWNDQCKNDDKEKKASSTRLLSAHLFFLTMFSHFSKLYHDHGLKAQNKEYNFYFICSQFEG